MLQAVTRVKRVYLFPANTTLGWRVIRMVTMEQALKHEAKGKWRRVYDANTNALIGFQLIAAEASRVDRDLPSMPSSASITGPSRKDTPQKVSEMEINADWVKSRTAGLPEDLRLEMHLPEDRVERVQQKVAVWPHVGPNKGDILVAWPKQ
jgi:hypothetical protein